MPAWLNRVIEGAEVVTPVRRRHLFGGTLTISDVCKTCNNGPLSDLDSHAKAWWNHRQPGSASATGAELKRLARWAPESHTTSSAPSSARGVSGGNLRCPPTSGRGLLDARKSARRSPCAQLRCQKDTLSQTPPVFLIPTRPNFQDGTSTSGAKSISCSGIVRMRKSELRNTRRGDMWSTSHPFALTGLTPQEHTPCR